MFGRIYDGVWENSGSNGGEAILQCELDAPSTLRVWSPGGAAPTDPVVCELRETRGRTSSFRSLIVYPTPGLTVPLSGSAITLCAPRGVAAAILAQLAALVAPGVPVAAPIALPLVSLGPAAVQAEDPIPWARVGTITVIDGAITTPAPIAAGASVGISPQPFAVTAGPAGATYFVRWEVVS